MWADGLSGCSADECRELARRLVREVLEGESGVDARLSTTELRQASCWAQELLVEEEERRHNIPEALGQSETEPLVCGSQAGQPAGPRPVPEPTSQRAGVCASPHLRQPLQPLVEVTPSNCRRNTCNGLNANRSLLTHSMRGDPCALRPKKEETFLGETSIIPIEPASDNATSDPAALMSDHISEGLCSRSPVERNPTRQQHGTTGLNSLTQQSEVSDQATDLIDDIEESPCARGLRRRSPTRQHHRSCDMSRLMGQLDLEGVGQCTAIDGLAEACSPSRERVQAWLSLRDSNTALEQLSPAMPVGGLNGKSTSNSESTSDSDYGTSIALPRGGILFSTPTFNAETVLMDRLAKSEGRELVGPSDTHAPDATRHRGGRPNSTLIICAASHIDALSAELRRRLVRHASHTSKRKLSITELSRDAIVLTTYGMLNARDCLQPALAALSVAEDDWRIKPTSLRALSQTQEMRSRLHTRIWDQLILLDAECLSNSTSQRTCAVSALYAECRWAVAGEACSGRRALARTLSVILCGGNRHAITSCERSWPLVRLKLVYNWDATFDLESAEGVH